MQKTIISIDPGANGGIAVLHGGYPAPVAVPMPDTEGDVLAYLRDIARNASLEGYELIAVVEDQTGCAGVQVSAPAMFKFGRNFGFILGVLQCLAARVELVKPQKWIGGLSLGKRDKTQPKTAWKNRLKAEAQRLYPNVNVTLATADALLLLEYYRKTR